MHRIQQRTGACRADLLPLIGWSAANLFLDPVQRGNPVEGLLSDRRSMRLKQVIELPANMRPACGFNNAPLVVEPIEPRKSISLERSPKCSQVFFRVFRF